MSPRLTLLFSSHRRTTLRISALALACALCSFCVLRAVAQNITTGAPGANCTGTGVCVSTYHNDNFRDGVNSNEIALKPSLFNTLNPVPDGGAGQHLNLQRDIQLGFGGYREQLGLRV